MTTRYPAVEAFMAVLAFSSRLSVTARTLRWLQYLYTEWNRRKAFISRRGDLSSRNYYCSQYLSTNLVGILGYCMLCFTMTIGQIINSSTWVE